MIKPVDESSVMPVNRNFSFIPKPPFMRKPRTLADFLRFVDTVLTYTNYPACLYEDSEENEVKETDSPLNSIGESAKDSARSSASSPGSSVEADSTQYDDSWAAITCFCGKPFAGRPMIECESCLVWLHLSCARVRKNNIPKHFKCSRCKPPRSRTTRTGIKKTTGGKARAKKKSQLPNQGNHSSTVGTFDSVSPSISPSSMNMALMNDVQLNTDLTNSVPINPGIKNLPPMIPTPKSSLSVSPSRSPAMNPVPIPTTVVNQVSMIPTSMSTATTTAAPASVATSSVVSTPVIRTQSNGSASKHYHAPGSSTKGQRGVPGGNQVVCNQLFKNEENCAVVNQVNEMVPTSLEKCNIDQPIKVSESPLNFDQNVRAEGQKNIMLNGEKTKLEKTNSSTDTVRPAPQRKQPRTLTKIFKTPLKKKLKPNFSYLSTYGYLNGFAVGECKKMDPIPAITRSPAPSTITSSSQAVETHLYADRVTTKKEPIEVNFVKPADRSEATKNSPSPTSSIGKNPKNQDASKSTVPMPSTSHQSPSFSNAKKYGSQ